MSKRKCSFCNKEYKKNPKYSKTQWNMSKFCSKKIIVKLKGEWRETVNILEKTVKSKIPYEITVCDLSEIEDIRLIEDKPECNCDGCIYCKDDCPVHKDKSEECKHENYNKNKCLDCDKLGFIEVKPRIEPLNQDHIDPRNDIGKGIRDKINELVSAINHLNTK